MTSRSVLLVQLPIPPAGPGEIEGNVPLAAAYLKLFARRRGLDNSNAIELLPTSLCNTLGDGALVREILNRDPTIVGFSCYVWNVERTIWIARRLKERRPEMKIVFGGPEITADNAWVLENLDIYRTIEGEGEAAFAELLGGTLGKSFGRDFPLDEVSSPYVEGILDIADGRMLLETVRGCRHRCKYCYYPKNHESPRFLSDEQIAANLRFAVESDAREVVLLDPTLNQRADFHGFLWLLGECNPQRKIAFSGELRAEGIDLETAALLKKANFREVEIGLQSVEPEAWRLMGRPTNLKAFERGVKAMKAEGIEVCVDLIIGLPGDTVESVRRGIDFLHRTGAYTRAQAFNLSILPGTAFRGEAERLGLKYQPWPPYYAIKTPTLDVQQMLMLVEESQEAFGVEFDAMPPPRLDVFDDLKRGCRIELDSMNGGEPINPPKSDSTGLCFSFWLRSADFQARRREAAGVVERFLIENPHTTLQIVLEPTGDPKRLTPETLELLLAACYRRPTYLDRYYSLHPGRLMGSKRLFVRLRPDLRSAVGKDWLDAVGEYATVIALPDGLSSEGRKA